MIFQTIQTMIVDEKIGILTLNRPRKRNAISVKMRQEISACLSNWQASAKIGVVIITGSGSTFSAGFDLNEFRQMELHEEIFKSSTQYHRDVWNFTKPTIAAVNGPALAGGMDLATLCDVRICAEAAVFGHPEIKYGVPPLFTPLRWIIGMGLARDLCLTGRTISSEDAFRIGLVSEIVESDKLLKRASQIAMDILQAPMESLQLVKQYLNENTGLGFEDSFCREHDDPFQEFLALQNEFLENSR